MRVFVEYIDDERRDITAHREGRRALNYVANARAVGLSDDEIALDLGGDDYHADGRTGALSWAAGAEIRGNKLVLFAPWNSTEFV